MGAEKRRPTAGGGAQMAQAVAPLAERTRSLHVILSAAKDLAERIKMRDASLRSA
jgi:hypothetical protein